MDLSDGERLFVYRRILGCTQAELGSEFDVHQTYVAAMERDSRPVRSDIVKWCKLPMTIPQHIMMAVLRKRKGYRLYTLAGLTGIEARVLGEMERGNTPIPEEVEKFLVS